jgi:hypothetical protein
VVEKILTHLGLPVDPPQPLLVALAAQVTPAPVPDSPESESTSRHGGTGHRRLTGRLSAAYKVSEVWGSIRGFGDVWWWR